MVKNFELIPRSKFTAQFLADLVTFTAEIVNGKLNFLWSEFRAPQPNFPHLTFILILF